MQANQSRLDDEFAGEPQLPRLRTEIDRIRSALAVIEQEFAKLEGRSRALPARSRPDRYYALLIDIYERGPHGVDGDELDELTRAHGYDRRGVNGYFKGSRAPLQRTGGRARLTVEGVRLVTEQLERGAEVQ
ncbi:MAG: hypothetical protein ACYC91_06720 [Solirubrobacteraceae bacterium]